MPEPSKPARGGRSSAPPELAERQLEILEASLRASGQQAVPSPAGRRRRGGSGRHAPSRPHQQQQQQQEPAGDAAPGPAEPAAAAKGRKGKAKGGAKPGRAGSPGDAAAVAKAGATPERQATPEAAKEAENSDPNGGSATPATGGQSAKKKNKARTKKGRFKEHWLQPELQAGMKEGRVFRAAFRCNANNRLEAFVSLPGLPTDVLIKGLTNQNRALPGDEVALELLPRSEWHDLDAPRRQTKQTGPALDADDADAEEGGGASPSSTLQAAQGSGGDPVAGAAAFLEANPNIRATGRVVAILEPSPRRERVVGSLMSEANGVAVLVPSDPRLPKMMVKAHTLPPALKQQLLEDCLKPSGEAHHLVSARIVEWTPGNLTPLAQVRESIGQAGEIETETAAILAAEGIEEADFSQDVLDCLPATPWEISDEEIAKRRDFRPTRVFTIDPLTARDLDDALSVEELDGGLLRIGVHIADVSHFVTPNTALDDEAGRRSTSVYLVQRVLPMLPHLLCQELCSLNPGVDRLAFSAVWDMTADGEIVHEWLGRTVIRSCVKLAYEHAQRMIEGTFTGQEDAAEEPIPCDLQEPYTWNQVVGDVLRLNSVAGKLRAARYKDGALRLNNVKLSFRLNEDGNPVSAQPYITREANHMIEEFMLLANRRVAEFISKCFPDRAMLRRHSPPNPHQLTQLAENLAKMKLPLDVSSSGAIHASLEALREHLTPSQMDIVIQQATKPMQLADYFCTGTCQDSPVRWRHYALAMSHYTHFTSPIRRYPDVIVHRLVAAALEARDQGVSKNEAAARHGLLGCDEISAIAGHANVCKLSAKNAQDNSSKVYLCVLLRSSPMILSAALMPIGGNQFCQAYVGALGVEVRIQVSEIHGRPEADFNTQTKSLHLTPNRRQSSGSTSDAATSVDDRGGVTYGIDNLTNPEAIDPIDIPVELKALQTVPVILTSVLSGSGRPSSVSAKLYVKASAMPQAL